MPDVADWKWFWHSVHKLPGPPVAWIPFQELGNSHRVRL